MKISLLLLLVLLIVSISSCESPKTDIIAGEKYKFWDLYNKRKYGQHAAGAYKISRDGECIYCIYDYRTDPPKLEKFDVSDVLESWNWSLIGDDSISLMGWEYKFLSLSEDTMILANSKREDTLLLVKTPNQHIKIQGTAIGSLSYK